MENMQNSRHRNINDQVSVDVDALTSSLTEELKQLHHVSRERCIYRVPKRLKELNEKAYTPQCVSIGPYHHGKDELKAMEEHKTMYLQHFLELSKVSLHEFVWCVKKNETRLRNCYEERIDLSSERFVRLMLVDAAFVIMVMMRRFSSKFDNEEELLLNKPWMRHDIRNDMILLENQLPFFILDHLFVLSNLIDGQISYNFLECLFTSSLVNPFVMLNFSKCKHLVDFIRIGYQPLEQNKHKALDALNLPSAVELHRAGVKFKLGSSLGLLDINFGDGILKIPQLELHDSSEILFRNLRAFEQTHLYESTINRSETYFDDYLFLISLFVTNGKDVEILTKEGIIENGINGTNEQVVHLLQNLVKENLVNNWNFYFTDVVNDLNKYYKYCNKRRNRWRANLIQTYFHNPWAVISVIAATLLLLLTIIQTICSILQVKQQQ